MWDVTSEGWGAQGECDSIVLGVIELGGWSGNIDQIDQIIKLFFLVYVLMPLCVYAYVFRTQQNLCQSNICLYVFMPLCCVFF